MSPSLSVNARFLTQPLTGVQRYSGEVLKAMDDFFKPGEVIAYCPPGPKLSADWKNIQLKQAGIFTGNLWEQFDLPRLSKGTLLFSPANIGPFFKDHQVVTIHDTSVFAHPEAYTASFKLKYTGTFRRMARTAEHIITTSEFSKRELQAWLNLAPERISVTYEGNEHIARISPDSGVIGRLFLGTKPFFLTVGSNSLHKNLQLVFKANELTDQRRYEIVMIGGDYSSVFQSPHLEQAQNIKKAGYLRDEELKALYIGASGLIFPSLYEGFGLPLLEAMACACPIICSDIPSSREVCDTSALFFDAKKPEDLASKLSMILDSTRLVSELKDRGLQRSKLFSWVKMAQETKQILDRFI